MTGPGIQPPALGEETSSILLDALHRLAALDGLTTREIAVRCVLTGTIPTYPAFSRDVMQVFARLENELVRGPMLEVIG
jgi:hypothetical protein